MMIEIFINGKWVALKVLDKHPHLSGFNVLSEPEDKAFHSLLHLNDQVVSLRLMGMECGGVFRIDSSPVFEPDSVVFCRASITKEVR
jgi:hypothetical protein